LLPQGFSEPLNARVSQFVDLDWCNSFDHLSDIMSNHVASKVFADKSVLCLGPDFVPLSKSKKVMNPYLLLNGGLFTDLPPFPLVDYE